MRNFSHYDSLSHWNVDLKQLSPLSKYTEPLLTQRPFISSGWIKPALYMGIERVSTEFCLIPLEYKETKLPFLFLFLEVSSKFSFIFIALTGHGTGSKITLESRGFS